MLPPGPYFFVFVSIEEHMAQIISHRSRDQREEGRREVGRGHGSGRGASTRGVWGCCVGVESLECLHFFPCELVTSKEHQHLHRVRVCHSLCYSYSLIVNFINLLSLSICCLIQLHERGKKKTFLGFKSFTFVFPLCGQDSFKNVDNRKTPALNLATRALSFMSFNLSLPFWSCSILGHRNPDGLTAPNACVHVGIISRFLWNPRSHKTERVSPQTDWAESHFLTQCHHCLWRCQL